MRISEQEVFSYLVSVLQKKIEHDWQRVLIVHDWKYEFRVHHSESGVYDFIVRDHALDLCETDIVEQFNYNDEELETLYDHYEKLMETLKSLAEKYHEEIEIEIGFWSYEFLKRNHDNFVDSMIRAVNMSGEFRISHKENDSFLVFQYIRKSEVNNNAKVKGYLYIGGEVFSEFLIERDEELSLREDMDIIFDWMCVHYMKEVNLIPEYFRS